MTHLRIATVAALAFATAASLSIAQPTITHRAASATPDVSARPNQAKDAARSHSGKGVVKAVDGARATVTIAHEPIPSLDWPAMTMRFPVTDRKLLAGLAPGAAVVFDLRADGNGRYVIASIRR